MKTISIILLVAAVIQIILTAPASDVPTTTITPLGPMDMDQLVEYYLKDRYHRQDVIAPEAISLIKALLEKLDDIIASPDNSAVETEIYQEFKSHFANFLKDVEDGTTGCGLKKVVKYHHGLIKNFVKSEDNEKIGDLFKSFGDDMDVLYRGVSDSVGVIYDNEALRDEVHKKAKFGTTFCKFWDRSLHRDMINGRCKSNLSSQ